MSFLDKINLFGFKAKTKEKSVENQEPRRDKFYENHVIGPLYKYMTDDDYQMLHDLQEDKWKQHGLIPQDAKVEWRYPTRLDYAQYLWDRRDVQTEIRKRIRNLKGDLHSKDWQENNRNIERLIRARGYHHIQRKGGVGGYLTDNFFDNTPLDVLNEEELFGFRGLAGANIGVNMPNGYNRAMDSY